MFDMIILTALSVQAIGHDRADIRSVIDLHNETRDQYGLFPLKEDKVMYLAAQSHTDWMTESHILVHSQLPYGENIACGDSMSTNRAVSAWMNSPGHRGNILGNYTRIGVGRRRCGDCNVVYYTVIFR